MLIFVKPEIVLRWRKRKFREFWLRKSQRSSGRPTIAERHISFLRRISADHPEYGEDHIALELEGKFGVQPSRSTIPTGLFTELLRNSLNDQPAGFQSSPR